MPEPALEERGAGGLPGLGATLRAAAGAGLTVGGCAGLFDGLVTALGIDPSLFLLRWKIYGPVHALTSGLPSWSSLGIGGLGGLVGCVLGSACVYGLLGLLGGAALGVVAHPFLRARAVLERGRAVLGMLLGGWVFLELYWWTRPIVFAGRASTDPRRLAAALGFLLLGLGIGWAIARACAAASPALRRRFPTYALVCVLLGGAYIALDRAGGSAGRGVLNERNRDLPNVVLFVVDALRQDVLGCYGSTEVRTPAIDELAREGALFEEAFVQAPFTWTSFGSILTGKYPRRHGLIKMAPGVRMGPNITFPYHLKGARRLDGVPLEETDFVTAAFMTGTLSNGSGLLRGFDLYFEALVGHELVDVHSRWSRFRSLLLLFQIKNKLSQRFDNQLVASTARDWIAGHADRRFATMVHYYSTHTPYDPALEFRDEYVAPDYDGPFETFYAEHRIAIEDGHYEPTDADRRQIRDLYHAGVAQADAMIGEVVDELERQGILDDTIVVVTSDHGEELGEHGVWEHNFMFQTNLRVPLVVRYPPLLEAGTRVRASVDSIDLLPTLCELMGLELPTDPQLEERGTLDGVSLLPLARGQIDRVREFSFAENGRFASIQDADFKLIVRWAALEADGWEEAARDPEAMRLFDIATDPGETRNVFSTRRHKAEELYHHLRAWSDAMPIGDHMLESERDARTEEILEQLGYGGGVGAGSEAPGEAPSPPGGNQ